MSREKNHSKKKDEEEERTKIEEGDEMMKFNRGINICSCWHANGARPNGIASRLSPPS